MHTHKNPSRNIFTTMHSFDDGGHRERASERRVGVNGMRKEKKIHFEILPDDA